MLLSLLGSVEYTSQASNFPCLKNIKENLGEERGEARTPSPVDLRFRDWTRVQLPMNPEPQLRFSKSLWASMVTGQAGALKEHVGPIMDRQNNMALWCDIWIGPSQAVKSFSLNLTKARNPRLYLETGGHETIAEFGESQARDAMISGEDHSYDEPHFILNKKYR